MFHKERPPIRDWFKKNLRDKATAAVIPLVILLPSSIDLYTNRAEEVHKSDTYPGHVGSGYENVITTFAPKKPEVVTPPNEIISFHQTPAAQEIPVFAGYELVSADAVVESMTERKLPHVPLYRQADPRWGWKRYGTASMADSGCGPTALAMVISYYKDRYIYPTETANQALKHHWRIPYVGTSSSAMTGMPKLYGLESKQVSWKTAKDALHHGKPIIQSHGPGYFTSSGHFIVITKASGNTYYINDPGPRHRTRATESEIKRSMEGSWLISQKQ